MITENQQTIVKEPPEKEQIKALKEEVRDKDTFIKLSFTMVWIFISVAALCAYEFMTILAIAGAVKIEETGGDLGTPIAQLGHSFLLIIYNCSSAMLMFAILIFTFLPLGSIWYNEVQEIGNGMAVALRGAVKGANKELAEESKKTNGKS